jgi:oligoribonuclease (3'-5' exoribonuclease)
MKNELRAELLFRLRKRYLLREIQRISQGGKVSILGGHSIDHSKQKMYMYMCPIPNGFQYRTISLYTVQTSNTPCPHTSCKVH